MIQKWSEGQSLKTILFIQIFLLALLLTGLLSFFSLYSFRQLLMRELGRARVDVLKQIGERIETIHSSAETVSNLYYYDEELGNMIHGYENGWKTQDELKGYLDYLESHYRLAFEGGGFDYFVALRLENGFEYTSPSGEDYDFSIPERTIWYNDVLKAQGGIWWSKTYRRNKEKGADSVLAAARTISDRETGKQVGTLFVVVPESALSKTYINVLTDYNNIYILNESGAILSHRDKKMVGINFYNMERFERFFGPDSYARVSKSGNPMFLINSYNSNLKYTIVEETPYAIIMSPLEQVYRTVIYIFTVCILVAGVLSMWVSRHVVHPLNLLCDSMKYMQKGDLEIKCNANGCLEVKQLSDGFNGMMDTTKQLIKDVEQKQEQKRRAELDFLQSQINPHFIYNTLFNIKCMAAMNRLHEVEDMISTFGKLLENTLNTSDEMLPLADEVDALTEYVHLLKYRYNNQFEVIYNISEESAGCKIPKLTLQPIVENAIFHGIEPQDEEGTIIINSWTEDQLLTIQVIDDGIGMKPEMVTKLLEKNVLANGKRSHIGLSNINERLKLFFGENYGIKVESEEEIGTTVTIQIPAAGGGKMYKVLIADDETPIRDWLEICVNSTGCKCKVVAKASNGRIALEKYQETLPDIVITDIKMPFMDGIDLITKIREQNKEVPVVILTSYTEFSYARQALQQGVTEYILKTEVTVERMKELLEKMIGNLERKLSRNGRDSYQLERRKSKFLDKCLTEGKSWIKGQLTAELHSLEIPLTEGNIAAVAFRDTEGSLIIEGQFEDIRVAAIFPLYHDNSLALCNISGQAGQNRQRETLYRMASYIVDRTGSSVGISDIYSGYDYLPILIKESAARLSQSFYDQKPSVHELETFRSDPETLSDLREIQQAFEASAKAANYEDSRDRLEEFIQFISIRKPFDIQMVRNTCMNMLKYFYYSYAPEAGRKLAYMEHIMAKIENSRTMYEIQQFVWQNIRQIQEDYEKIQVQYSVPVQRSIDYLQQNYQKNLTLPVISAYVGFSPDYFSRIFKGETGINFSSYLTKYRLKKALELLQTTNMKVYEVSIAVGYSNMSYFSTVFKKEYGVNPFDFKNSSKQKQEAVVTSAKIQIE